MDGSVSACFLAPTCIYLIIRKRLLCADLPFELHIIPIKPFWKITDYGESKLGH